MKQLRRVLLALAVVVTAALDTVLFLHLVGLKVIGERTLLPASVCVLAGAGVVLLVAPGRETDAWPAAPDTPPQPPPGGCYHI